MDTLDAHGKELYENFQRAQREWLAYVSPIAIKYADLKLSAANGMYYKYAYITAQYLNEKIQIHPTDETTELYKKLALRFHPDKFKNTCAAAIELFQLINKAHQTDNFTLLQKIDTDTNTLLSANDEYLSNYVAQLEIGNQATLADDFTIPMDSPAYRIFMEPSRAHDYFYTTDELIKHLEYGYLLDTEIEYYTHLATYDESVRLGLEKRALHNKGKY